MRLHEVHKALPVTPFGRFGLHAKCDLSGRLGAHAIQEPQPPRPIRELQLIPAVLVDCSFGGTRKRLGRAVCLIDTSALGHVSRINDPRFLYCGTDDTLEVLNVCGQQSSFFQRQAPAVVHNQHA